MLDRNTANDVLCMALSTGGDFAEIFIENTKRNGITMINGVVEKALSGVDYGCGIRIFNGFNAIYTYTNDTSKENLLKIAKEAAQALNKPMHAEVLPFISKEINDIHPISKLPGIVSKQEICELLHQASDAAFAYNDQITQTSMGYIDVIQDVCIINSEGLWATDRRVRSHVRVGAIASSASEKQTGGFSPGARMGNEFLETIDMKKLGADSAKIAVTMLNADLCPSGKMPVIIDNGFGGVIFHEACGHSLEATSVAKKSSVFADKLGCKIAADCVTAIDDGTIPNAWGSINIDDEGTDTRKNVLIESGILKSFMIDRLNGIKMGMPSTGSSRRESYKYAPTSRMTNTYIAAGKSTCNEIISGTEYGLYAKKMGGGSVQPATGEFNFAVLEAYMIRNGKIAEPVRGATLIGKGSEILLNIDAVSDNLAQEQGMCGSVSGAVPTNCGQPMIRVKEITVGGRSDK